MAQLDRQASLKEELQGARRSAAGLKLQVGRLLDDLGRVRCLRFYMCLCKFITAEVVSLYGYYLRFTPYFISSPRAVPLE